MRVGPSMPAIAANVSVISASYDSFESRLDQRVRRVVAKTARVGLPELMAAAMPMQVAVSADVHHDVERVEPAAKSAQQFIALGAGAQRDVDHFVAAGGAPAGDHVVEFVIGPIGHRVQQRRRDIGMSVDRPSRKWNRLRTQLSGEAERF